MKANLKRILILGIFLLPAFLPACASRLSPCAVQYYSAPYFIYPDGSIQKDPGRSGQPIRFQGSGFVWGGRYVITSEHALQGKTQNVRVYQSFFQTKRVKGEVIRKDGGVALIRLRVDEALPSLSLAEKNMKAGEPVTILDGASSPAIPREAVAVFPDSVRLSNPIDFIGNGASGSPVVNRRGEVVGIVCGTLVKKGMTTVLVHSVSEIEKNLGLRTLGL